MKKRTILIVATILLITVLATCLVACGGVSPQKDNARVTEDNAKKIKDGKYTLAQCVELLGEPTFYNSEDIYCWIKEEKKYLDFAKDHSDSLLLLGDAESKTSGLTSRFDTKDFTLNGRKVVVDKTLVLLNVAFEDDVFFGVSFNDKVL